MKKILKEVKNERHRQDKKWGGSEHDDAMSIQFFLQTIQDYAGWARVMDGMKNHEKTRKRLVQVAALAVAAVQSLDRRELVAIDWSKAPPDTTHATLINDRWVFESHIGERYSFWVEFEDSGYWLIGNRDNVLDMSKRVKRPGDSKNDC